MNPDEKAAHKDGKNEINGLCGIRRRNLTEHTSPGRSRRAQFVVYEWLTIIRKDCESAGGHRQLASKRVNGELACP
jgi:hypothetical protein